MDFPFGRHHHHHSQPEEDPNPNPNPNLNPNPNPYPAPAHNPYGYQPSPPPPQPFYGGGPGEYPPPPPPVHHVSHEYGRPGYAPPPHNEYGYGRPEYAPPPPVQHMSHEVGTGGGYGFENQGYHHHQQQRPGFSHSPAPHVERVSYDNRLGELLRQPTVRIYTKAAENYSLSIREGSVVLVPSDPRDEHQHWIKDLRYSTRVKDEEGLPSFAIVNKVTGQAIKHAIGATHPVRLVPYNPDYLDESVLWTESKDTGEGFRCIRMLNNIRLNFDAFHGDEDHGGVRDGTTIVLWEWLKGKNQRWKIVPYCKLSLSL